MASGIRRLPIYAKASLDIGEIQEKICCGCDAIEVNLEEDFLQHGSDFLGYYGKEVLSMKEIYAVHVPFNQDNEMLNLEWVFGRKDISVLRNVFALAQYCGQLWKHRVVVVIHSCMAMYDFQQFELLQESIVDGLKRLFNQCDMVDLAIENTVLLELGRAKQFRPRLCNGIYSDTCELVEWLRGYFGERVGSVLDICHARMTEKYLKLLLEAADVGQIFSEDVLKNINMEYFFDVNQRICKLIHFNNMQGNGYVKNHGVSFKNLYEVNKLLELYEKYQYRCPLTLEIREDDYLNCVNYKRTKKLIETAGYVM